MDKAICRSALVALSLASVALPALSQSYPERPVRLVVPFAPGAANDTLGRLVAEGLGKRLNQTVVVENRPGAGGQIGISYAVKAAPDGYTILLAETGGLSILSALKQPAPYDVAKDFTYLARLAVTPYAVVVRADMPVSTYKELIDYGIKHPGGIRHGHSGQGSINQLLADMLADRAGMKITHVPYKGMANVVTDLAAGHIDMGLVSPSTIAPFVASGKVKPLVLISNARHRLLPDVPSYRELGYAPIEGDGWYGVVAPAGLPQAVARKLGTELSALMADPVFQTHITDKGFVVSPMDGAAFRTFVIADQKQWGDLGRANHIKID